MEKLDFLINYLLKENENIKINKNPTDKNSKKRLYRSLCNIRDPKPIDEKYIEIENEYLQEELKNCYINSLELAKENNIKEIAFPCISTGEFRFPKKIACKVAIETVKEYLKNNEKYFNKIVFNVFTDEDYDIYLGELGDKYGKL